MREKRRYCVANLNVLFGAWSTKEVVTRKSLQPGSLADRQTSALARVWVNIRVAGLDLFRRVELAVDNA